MRNHFKIIFLLFILLFSINVKSQQFTGIADTLLLKNAHQLKYSFPDSAIQISEFIISKKETHDSIVHDAYEINGDAYWHKGNFVKSIDYYSKALFYAKKINEPSKISREHSNLGYLYMEIGEYDKAIEELKKSMEMALKHNLNDRYLIASTYLASIWGKLKQYDKGIEIQQRAIQKLIIIKDSASIAIIQNNIASNYLRAGNLDSAEFYYEKALIIDRKLNKVKEVANSLLSLSEIYLQRNELSKSKKTVLEAIDFYKKNNTFSPLSLSYTTLAKINAELNNFEEAKNYMVKALYVATQSTSRDLISSAYLESSKIYKKAGDVSNALKYMELYIQLNDSIYQEESATKIAQMSVRLELSGKEKEIELLNTDKKLQQLELKNKRNQQYGLYGGLVLVIAFAGFMYNRFKVTQKQKTVIEDQKTVVEKAHHELEEKNKEITDSITYAKRIQSAILPPKKLVKEYLPESFILYKPKDIVAGDFYWMEHKNGKILFAAADCTGHGVPGAMVSVVCNNGLNRSVREHGLTDPGKILDKTREIVIQEFEKSDEEVKDGMDISLCGLDLNNYTLAWSGANNPLWIIRPVRHSGLDPESHEILEYKPDKQPIGKYAESKPFTTHQIQLEKGDSIYIYRWLPRPIWRRKRQKV